ncbi:MAG TPA: 2-oxoacid:ferredoxin oxidoreductase subunit beta [Dehalococcoidia bacterium]|nr:2-oxoacid:ferredoxin oxidoreductase subunit beta [Dehalococcoidia bacterium]
MRNRDMVERYFRRGALPTTWCPGCGLGTATGAMVRAIDQLGLDADKVVIVTGIGCSGQVYTLLNFDGFHGTHGRALAAATGIKFANPELTVIAPMGDGDCAAIGGNHFIQAARRNMDITAIIMANQAYGMTGGQYSPLTPMGSFTSTSPYGHIEPPFDMCALAIAAGATYVARGTVYHTQELVRLIARGIAHRGFSVIEVLAPCPVQFGRRNAMATPVDMFRQLQRATVSVREAELHPEAIGGRAVRGVLREVEGPEFTAEYEALIRRAKGDTHG